MACDQKTNQCPEFEYQCLVNPFFNGTLEGCGPVIQIFHNACAEFNIHNGSGVIQGSQSKERECQKCPPVYPSNNSYMYQECYDHVKRPTESDPTKKNGTLLSTTLMVTRQPTIPTENKEDKSWTDVTMAVIIMIPGCLVFGIAFMVIKRQCRANGTPVNQSESEEESVGLA
ncbi:uncharacterized protein LOC125675076 isoform X2 [Ostrea edulis]|nr:uncharacterized protein LOC125675076 isoform X2 [Ostrea edulis]